MKANLLLLDSYENMESLVDYAFSFCSVTNRQLKIFFVFDVQWMSQSYTVGSASVADPVMVSVEGNAKKRFEDAELHINTTAERYHKKHTLDIPYEIHVSDKNRVDLVIHETDKNPDLILLMSSNQSYAEASGGPMGYPNLIFSMKCPVFVIPDNSAFHEFKNIAFATNFHPEDIEALKHLSGLFKSSDLNVIILHNEEHFGFEEKLKWKGFLELVKETTGIDSVIPVLKNEKRTLNAIEHYVNDNNPDLLVVVKENKGFFKELFSTSNTKNLLTHFNKPVLVYHEN